jgi:predicted ferric reductase
MKTYFKKYFPIILLFALILTPIARWFFLEPISSRFFDLNSSMTSIGQITGLLGMILFSINLILSNRSVFFDRLFSGLHKLYFFHKWLGAISFSLLLFHPLFLVVKYVRFSLLDAAMFLLPGGEISITMGIVSLGLMIILLILTIHIKIKYHIWRFSHKFLVIAFIFAIIHTILISSDISRDIFLRYYILLFAFLGLLSGAYRSFFRFILNEDYEFIVKKIDILNSSVVEIEIEPRGKIMKFFPGQFIFIRFVGVGISSETHPFSITSMEGDNNIKILIKKPRLNKSLGS